LVSTPESAIKSLLIGNKLNLLKFPWHKTVSGSQQVEIDSTQNFRNKLAQSQYSGKRSEGEDTVNSKSRSLCCAAAATQGHKRNMALFSQEQGDNNLLPWLLLAAVKNCNVNGKKFKERHQKRLTGICVFRR